MSRTWSHGKNFEKKHAEAYKNRATGYEYWSSRPGNYCSCPGRITKNITKAKERAEKRQILNKALQNAYSNIE